MKKRNCLLKLSSSSILAAPGLKYLKGAMKVDKMLTFSVMRRKKKNIQYIYELSAGIALTG